MSESITSANGGLTPIHENNSAIPTPHSAIIQADQHFSRFPGETPRAYGAFIAFFDLGHARSLSAVAEKLGEGLATVKNWSSKYSWSERIQDFNSGVLQYQAAGFAEAQRRHAVDWAQRLAQFREQQWEVSQKLAAVAQCFLESFGDENLSQMTLGQASRALRISSDLARFALTGTELPEDTEQTLSPAQQSLMDAFRRVYGQAPASPLAQSASPNQDTAGAQPAESKGSR